MVAKGSVCTKMSRLMGGAWGGARGPANHKGPGAYACARTQVESTGVLPTETIVRQAVENLMSRIDSLQLELRGAEQMAGMEALLL